MSVIDRAFIRAFQGDDAPVLRSSTIGRATAQQAGVPPLRIVGEGGAPSSTSEDEESPQRRPLSAFAAPRTVESHFKPALEVDAFRWSRACQEIVSRHAQSMHPAVQTLLAADDAGRSLIGIGGATRGSGATLLVACLARLLVDAGKTVAVVDGNFETPGLAEALGVAAEVGWEDVLAGKQTLAECVINSLGDRLALLPLIRGGPSEAEKLDSIQASVTAGVLRYHYNIVLVDLGALDNPIQGAHARRLARQCRLDGLIIASDRAADGAAGQPQRLMQAAPELAAICLGTIENQASAA